MRTSSVVMAFTYSRSLSVPVVTTDQVVPIVSPWSRRGVYWPEQPTASTSPTEAARSTEGQRFIAAVSMASQLFMVIVERRHFLAPVANDMISEQYKFVAIQITRKVSGI